MELTVLVDNNNRVGNCLISEHGLSFFIKEDDVQLLFDCGSSDAFIKNAYKMDMDLEHVTDIILSHSHRDHVGGFLRLQSLYKKFKYIGLELDPKNVIAHPDVFKEVPPKEIKEGEENPQEDETLHLSKDKLEKFFNLTLTNKPVRITPKLIYLGEIPLKYGNVKEDYASDETALAYKSKDGLIVISGCSHSGVENIIEHAKFVTGENRIHTLIGGLYLINRDGDEINALGRYLQSQNIKQIYPCHCTDLESKIILSKFVVIKEVNTGKRYTWE